MNVMIPLTASAGILTYAWPYARTKASLITVVVLYGYAPPKISTISPPPPLTTNGRRASAGSVQVPTSPSS